MSGKYYWIKTKGGTKPEIGYKRDSGLWEMCGIDVMEDINDIISEVIGEVSEWSSDEKEQALHKHFVNTRNYRLVMLHDYNVVKLEWRRPHTYIRCLIGGFIWRFMPDLTFKHRRFMIVDYGC